MGTTHETLITFAFVCFGFLSVGIILSIILRRNLTSKLYNWTIPGWICLIIDYTFWLKFGGYHYLFGTFVFVPLGVVLVVVNYIIVGKFLINKLQMVVDHLVATVGEVGTCAQSVASASLSLADGSSEQAAAIEEASSSLEEMAAMTKQNAANSNLVNQLMTQTRDSISLAGQTMAALTSSMGEISKASEETSKIIKTIDEIAFQTNLLALNAAVEAARAGDSGAGFAVVADEVRSLAMRAAEAAKNTATLIESTVKRVHEGSTLVVKTDKEFREVTLNVRKSSELIGEISVASQEQAQGIDQVNIAVNEMNKVVQNNSATSEESAASAEEMKGQAEQMEKTVKELQNLIRQSRDDEVVREPGRAGESQAE